MDSVRLRYPLRDRFRWTYRHHSIPEYSNVAQSISRLDSLMLNILCWTTVLSTNKFARSEKTLRSPHHSPSLSRYMHLGHWDRRLALWITILSVIIIIWFGQFDFSIESTLISYHSLVFNSSTTSFADWFTIFSRFSQSFHLFWNWWRYLSEYPNYRTAIRNIVIIVVGLIVLL